MQTQKKDISTPLHFGRYDEAICTNTDRLEWPYKSGVTKIIGSVDKVGNHCLNEVSLVCDRPTHWFLAMRYTRNDGFNFA